MRPGRRPDPPPIPRRVAEIQQALTDISCKKQTSLLTKWDSVESKIQDALIAKNQLALTNGLKAEQELVKYAESVIS